MTKLVPYWMLFCREADGAWYAQFGAYTRKEVTAEERDTYAKEYKRKDRCIIRLENDDDSAMREAEARLNPQLQHDEHVWAYAVHFKYGEVIS